MKNFYNYGCREFDTAELRTLMDAVEASAFISPRKTDCLIHKISGLMSQHDAQRMRASVYTGKVVKTENNNIFLIIDVIDRAINTGKKIAFQHFTYDGNRRRVMRNNGEVYTVSPYLTIWKNDRYYLVYKVFLSICDDMGVRDEIPTMEDEEGSAFLLEQLQAFATPAAFVEKMQYEPHRLGDVLLLTGVGDVFPYMRVHALLEALQPVFSDIPILVMYPGTFDKSALRLFDVLTPNAYYRAFNAI